MILYKIVHVRPDRTEKELRKTKSPTEVRLIVDSPRFAGTWLTETEKLLRYGMGEIHIREQVMEPEIGRCTLFKYYESQAYFLSIKYHDTVKALRLTTADVTGIDRDGTELWSTNSFGRLAEYITQEVAYRTRLHYEQLLQEFGLEGAM